jgi:hypothetical protein
MAVSWGDFELAAPEISGFGAGRFQSGVAYLATVRSDGAPRVHPVTPIIGEGRLFLYMEPTSPKGKDLERDNRYQMHCSVENSHGGSGEFYVTGTARQIPREETATWETASRHGYKPKPQYILFELLVDSAFSTVYAEDKVVRNRWKLED